MGASVIAGRNHHRTSPEKTTIFFKKNIWITCLKDTIDVSLSLMMQPLSPELILQENLTLRGENAVLKDKIASLEFRLNELLRLVYGSKSEKFVSTHRNDGIALSLFADAAQVETAVKEVAVKAHTKIKSEEKTKPTGRRPFPEKLEREIIEIQPVEDITGLTKIGEEVTEQLDYVPGKLFVKRYVRSKYARLIDEQTGRTKVLIGALPDFPIEKGIPAAGLLAQICVDKFCDHLPVYRQIKRYERLGMTLKASTINGWLEGIDHLLQPLKAALQYQIQHSNYLQADESPIKVLDDNKKGRAHQGYMWLYRDPGRKLVYFDYRPGRDAKGSKAFLENYRGYLQTDGYQVYENPHIGTKDGVQLLHCLAHARRYFDKSLDYDRPRAEYFISQIQLLYQVEKEIRENKLSGAQITKLRREKAVPVLQRLGEWLNENYAQVLDRTPIGKAIGYSLQRWDRLCLYTTQPYLQPDNNGIENAVRPLAVGRRNFLFAGSHKGAERMALLYSLMACCKSHGINPYDYLKNLLTRIASYPHKQIAQLLPHNWQPAAIADPAAH
jgi:transposase